MFYRRSLQRLILSFFGLVVLAWLPAILNAATNDAKSRIVLTGQRVLILGDSITQDGRYVTFLDYFLHQLAPVEKSDLISIGLSSETLSGLSEKGHPFPRPCVLERLDRALKTVKPQVVFACYGMNDGIYHPPSAERLAAFNRGLRQLITQVRATGAQLVLLTPPVFDALPIHERTVPATATEFGYGTPYAGYDDVLVEFSSAELAVREPGVTTIDLHRALATVLAAQREHDATFTFAPDGIHPNDAGHLLIARTILQGLGYVQADPQLAVIQADPLFPLIRERRQLRSEAWLPFVGYIRGDSFKSASITAAEEAALRLQNEINAATPK
jgi:lysophospholipase L1-like esterase